MFFSLQVFVIFTNFFLWLISSFIALGSETMHGMISFCTCWVQVNIKLFMFTYFRERETQHEQGRGRERERRRIRSRPQALSCQHRVRHRAQTHKPWDDDLSWSQMLNWLSPPATHFNEVLNDTVQRALATWQTQRERKKCEETGSGKSRLLSFTVIWLWRLFFIGWSEHSIFACHLPQ